MAEALVLDLVDAESVALSLEEGEQVALSFTEEVVRFEVLGEVGAQGPRGYAATVAVGTTLTGPPGSEAVVINVGTENDAVFDFTIPEGEKGDKGDKGDEGTAATITVGDTVTGAPGSPATVTNTGTTLDAVFDFTIPEGLKGDTGDAATLSVGDTTASAPGSTPSVTNSGDQHHAVLDFVLPRGDTGPQGPPGLDTGFYRHNQAAPATVWNIAHNLGFFPSVSVQDSAGSVVYGDIDYVDANNVTVTFDAAMGGYANLS